MPNLFDWWKQYNNDTGGLNFLAELSKFSPAFSPFSWMNNASRLRTHINNMHMREVIRNEHPELSDKEIEQLITMYGDSMEGKSYWNPLSVFTNNEDLTGLEETLRLLSEADSKIGKRPYLSTDDYDKAEADAYAEFDKEQRQLLDLYEQSMSNTKSQLENEMLENSAMFGDMRNQMLTNEAMRQQAIAGSTRFELDRQQRNAIVRGASAAQRLVANINTQLGLQAQSAQQSLDTSNALAQNLLAHRQAQQNIRNSYLQAQNNYTNQVASTIQGSAANRFAYGQARKQGALNDYQAKYDIWDRNASDYFGDNDTARTIYSNRNKGSSVL